MVKTNSPLASSQAGGSLAGLITYYGTRRQHAIRTRVRPRDPRTRDQRSRRAIFRFLTQEWAGLSTANKDTWTSLGQEHGYSAYNAYVAHQLENWHNLLAPGWAYPLLRTGSLGTVFSGPSAAWVEHIIQLKIHLSPYGLNWGIIYYARPQSGFDTHTTNAIYIQRVRTGIEVTTQWTPPDEGAWHFNARLFSIRGNLGPELGEFAPP